MFGSADSARSAIEVIEPNRELTAIALTMEILEAGREPERKLRATILLVDPDLGFVFWLGQALDSAGYSALPAESVRSAQKLIREHRVAVDILVIDPLLPDALEFISHLRETRPALKVVAAIAQDWEKLTPMTKVDAFIRKPESLTAMASLQWINLIQNLWTAPQSETARKILLFGEAE